MAAAVESYDYIMVGDGSGGSGAARRAAGRYGTRTLSVEAGDPGAPVSMWGEPADAVRNARMH